MTSANKQTVSENILNVLGEARGELALQCADIMENGLLDSFSLLELAASLEVSLNITIPTNELITDNFRNLNAIVRLVDGLSEH